MLEKKLLFLIKQKQFTNLIIYGFGQGFNLITPLLVIPYIVLICGEEGYGKIGVGMALAFFIMVFIDYGSLDFKDGIWKAVKGSDNDQTIEFSLPESVFPTQLRMDFGKNQEEILLKNVKFEYNEKTREIKGFETGVFFRADESKCSYDATMGIIKALEKDGKKEAISLYPNEAVMKAELPKLK